MRDPSFQAELERRLQLLETPGTDESFLPDLPRRDVWLAGITLAVLLTWWGYPA